MDSQRADYDHHTAIEHCLVWLTRLLGAGVLALVAVTWKLWTPQEVFPRVPLFRWAPPDWWDWASLALIIASGIGLLIRPQRHVRSLAATLAVGLAIAFVCDQHRLQPWAWQFFILALLIALADDALLWSGWQWLTISIYFYSALSKFDAEFLSTTAEVFVRSIDGLVPLSSNPLRLSSQYHGAFRYVSYIFPVAELAISLLLISPWTRRWGTLGAVLMHLALLRILGPSGLRHTWGVLLWNVFFLLQTTGLFAWNDIQWLVSRYVFPRWQMDHLSPFQNTRNGRKIGDDLNLNRPLWVSIWRNRLASTLLAVILIAPATTPWGLCDSWIGWAVYVRPYEVALLQANFDVVGFMSVPAEQLGKVKIVPRPDRQNPLIVRNWSLKALSAPPYPHLRCTLGAALDLRERSDGVEIIADVSRRNRQDDRWSERRRTYLNSTREIHEYCKRFWFNAYPTSMYRRAAREKLKSDDG